MFYKKGQEQQCEQQEIQKNQCYEPQAKQSTQQSSLPYDQQVHVGQFQQDPSTFDDVLRVNRLITKRDNNVRGLEINSM